MKYENLFVTYSKNKMGLIIMDVPKWQIEFPIHGLGEHYL